MAVFHGGNLAAAAQRFSVPQEKWVDLSTGINPHPYPIPPLEQDHWGRLPDQKLLQDLKEAAAFYYGVDDPEKVIPVSGTQTLLQILPHLFEKPKKVRIIGPTYKEHAYCWSLAGHDVMEVEDVYDAADEADILIIVNPNNPTGDVYEPDFLLELAAKQHAKGGYLIVDGAFLDCRPSLDISSHAGTDGLIILRSFGKFFGLAGIRLGFVLAGGKLADRLRDGIGPWAVNGPAMEIGKRAFRDVAWIKQTRADLIKATQRLDEILGSASIDVVGGTSLFRYCHHPKAPHIFEGLGKQGVLVRPFEDRAQYLRIGLPGPEKHWAILQESLKELDL
ncbi:Threonine-phosphate decarboxylase [Candidatus Terasakiella magnetica]|uniref:threonine-phosphate decarboxylase n=1 Tax=Candidatus Terasakiella magnetica TaxID=1867952 RepID=A0A1C3RDA3_9PROT|nr:threonine-phosphate decarboxylase CobD [Candidatus Terasakiella magnetica]SCA55228.1 Threonine-phosphate decarboxylase [Candidatus Terasakiella magnetica]